MPKRKDKWALEDIQSFRGQELEEEETAAAAPIPLPEIPQPPPVGPIAKPPVTPKPATKAVEPPEIYDTLEGWEDSLRRMNMQPPVQEAAPTGQPFGVPPVTAVPPEFVRDTIATTKYVDQVHQSLVNLFPEEDDVTLDSVIAFANAMPNEFLGVLRDLGRSLDAERILAAISPSTTPDQFWQGQVVTPTGITSEMVAAAPTVIPSLDWLDKLSEIGENPAKLLPFISSGAEIYTIGKLLKSAQDLEAGKEISEADLLALKEYVDRSQMDTDFGYKVADVLTNVIPFALELYLTGGTYTVGSRVTIKAATVALKKLATKSGTKILEKKLVQYGLKVIGTVAGGTLRTIPSGVTRIPATTIEKQLQGTLTGDEEPVWESAIKSFGEHWVEVVSEGTGGLFSPLTSTVKGGLVKTGLFKAFLKVNPGKKPSDLKRIIERFGYHGVFEEMGEERVADVAHGILEKLGLGDQAFSFPSLEQLSVELVSFSIPGVAMKAIESIGPHLPAIKATVAEAAFKTGLVQMPGMAEGIPGAEPGKPKLTDAELLEQAAKGVPKRTIAQVAAEINELGRAGQPVPETLAEEFRALKTGETAIPPPRVRVVPEKAKAPGEAEQAAKGAAPPTGKPVPEIPQLVKTRFSVDEKLEMRSPYSGDVVEVSFRGEPSSGKAMVWTGTSQMEVPTEWLSRSREGQLQILNEQLEIAKQRTSYETAKTRITHAGLASPEFTVAYNTQLAIEANIRRLEKPTREAVARMAQLQRDTLLANKVTKDAQEVATAPIYQKSNGWDVIKRDIDYVLRDPYTKEEVYSGKLSRVRQVASESKPKPVPEKVTAPEVAGKGVGKEKETAADIFARATKAGEEAGEKAARELEPSLTAARQANVDIVSKKITKYDAKVQAILKDFASDFDRIMDGLGEKYKDADAVITALEKVGLTAKEAGDARFVVTKTVSDYYVTAKGAAQPAVTFTNLKSSDAQRVRTLLEGLPPQFKQGLKEIRQQYVQGGEGSHKAGVIKLRRDFLESNFYHEVGHHIYDDLAPTQFPELIDIWSKRWKHPQEQFSNTFSEYMLGKTNPALTAELDRVLKVVSKRVVQPAVTGETVTLKSGKVVPLEPVTRDQSYGTQMMDKIKVWDARGEPDYTYKQLTYGLAGRRTDTLLKKGETWRGRAVAAAENDLKRHPVIPEPAVAGEAAARAVEPTAAEVQKALAVVPPIKPPMPPSLPALAEPGDAAKMFADYLVDPSRERGAALQAQLFATERAKRFARIVPRLDELIASGMTVEAAIDQAKKEIMTGSLPRVTTDYFDEMTARARNDLFTKVRDVLQNEPTELVATEEALTNALLGQEIPMKIGTGTPKGAFPLGGSALKRLQRVFAPEQLVGINKLGKAKKTIREIAETVWHEPSTEVGGAQYPGGFGLQGDLLETLTPEGPSAVEWAKGYIAEHRRIYDVAVKEAYDKYQAEMEISSKRYEAEIEAWEKIPIWERKQSQQFELGIEPTGEGPSAVEWAKENIREAHGRYAAELQAAQDKYDAAQQAATERFNLYRTTLSARFSDVDAKQLPLLTLAEKGMIVRILKEMGLTLVDIGNLIRANKTSFDFSFWRQAKLLASGHPIAMYKANIDAWKAMWNQKEADAQWQRIIRDPDYAIYEKIRKETGADPLRVPDVKKGTEQWRGAEEYGYLTGERPIPRFTAKIPWIKVSARSFNAGTNSIVWQVWKDKLKLAKRMNENVASGQMKMEAGEGFSITQEMADHQKMLADVIQRASLGDASKLAPTISAVFFAARSKLARFIFPRHLISGNPRVMAEAWKDFILMNSVFGGIMLLGDWLDLWETEKDPRNAEVMSARIGNLRIDPWAGYRQFAVLYARLWSGTGVSSATGAEYEIDKIGALTKFFRNSLAPLTGILLDFWTGRNFLGEVVEITNSRQWIERIAPLALWDIWEAFEEGSKEGVIAIIPAILGEGVQTYTGDWKENFTKMGLPKYAENTAYGITKPPYDAGDLWADTAHQFKGVDPATLTASKGFPEYIRVMASALKSLETLDSIPNQTLISIGTDPKGLTLQQYSQMWQERKALVEAGAGAILVKRELQADGKYKEITYKGEDAVSAFDNDEVTRNAKMGNMSQTQYALLTEYHLTSKDEQKQFLKDHPEIDINPNADWLKTHTIENAELAIHGKAKILTQEAYDIARKLTKKLDYPDASVEDFLPPKDVAKPYFDYQDADNPLQARLIRAQNPNLDPFLKKSNPDLQPTTESVEGLILKVDNYDKTKEYDALTTGEAQEAFKADPKNKTWLENEDRIEAYSKGTRANETPKEIVDLWVKKKNISRAKAGYDAEEKLFYIDNPEVHQWALDNKLSTDTGVKWNEPSLRITAARREEDAAYEAIDPDAKNLDTGVRLRDEWLAKDKNAGYRLDRRRREGYELTHPKTGERFPVDSVEKYVAYAEAGVKGKRQERLLASDPAFNQLMHDFKGTEIYDINKVPSVQYDDIYDANKDKFEEYDALTGDDRQAFLENDRKFAREVDRREAYGLLLDKKNPAYVDEYVKHYEFPDKGMERELHLAERPDFEKAKWLAENKNAKPSDFQSKFRSSNTNIPPWSTKHIESLKISVKYKDKDVEYDEANAAGKERILYRDPVYAKARYTRQGYDLKVRDEYVPNFADFRMIPEKGMSQERYMQKNIAFYNYATQKLGFEKILSKLVWSEEFEKFYDRYNDTAIGAARKELRWGNPTMDAEGERMGLWDKLDRQPNKLSAADKWLKEAAERIAAIKVR